MEKELIQYKVNRKLGRYVEILDKFLLGGVSFNDSNKYYLKTISFDIKDHYKVVLSNFDDSVNDVFNKNVEKVKLIQGKLDVLLQEF